MMPMFDAYRTIWTLVNLLGLIGLIAGFIIIVIATWRQSVAQKQIAAALEEITQKLGGRE